MKRTLVSLALVLAVGPGAARAQDSGWWSRGSTSGAGRVRVSGGSVPDEYEVQEGDTLWDITSRVYGTPWVWPRVWSFNPEITNPHWIYPLDRLRLYRLDESGELATGGALRQRLYRPSLNRVFLRWQGYLDRDALEEAGRIVGAPEEQMILSHMDRIYVRFARNEADVRPGQEFTVFRRMFPDERAISEEGELVRIFGTIRIEDYDLERHLGHAVILEAFDPIERGFQLTVMPRELTIVPPLANDRTLEARVVAALRPVRLLAEQQIIYVNVGGEAGVRPGHTFRVVRRADEWRRDLVLTEEQTGALFPEAGVEASDDLPWETVAEARVIDVREKTAGLLVTSSLREVTYGDVVRMEEASSPVAAAAP